MANKKHSALNEVLSYVCHIVYSSVVFANVGTPAAKVTEPFTLFPAKVQLNGIFTPPCGPPYDCGLTMTSSVHAS